jgi:hypothetical protein
MVQQAVRTAGCQQCHIDIHRLTRFAPSLEGEASDEAETPPFGFANCLKIGRRPDDGVHGRRARKRRCCSTNPEVGFGALGGSK